VSKLCVTYALRVKETTNENLEIPTLDYTHKNACIHKNACVYASGVHGRFHFFHGRAIVL